MDLTDTPGQSWSGYSCVKLQISLQTPQIPISTSGTLAWPPPCAVMSHDGNKIPLLGQSCGEERGALAEIIYFTVKGKYRKYICCSIFSQLKMQKVGSSLRVEGLVQSRSGFWEVLSENKELIQLNPV